MAGKPSKEKVTAILEIWNTLSKEVRQSRLTPYASQTNLAIDRLINEGEVKMLTPYLLNWKGDNFIAEGRLPEAIKEYLLVIAFAERNPKQLDSLKLSVYKKAFRALVHNNEHTKAINLLNKAKKAFPQAQNTLSFQGAELLNRTARIKDAERIYESILKNRKKSEPDTRLKKAAERSILLLKQGNSWSVANPELLSHRLCDCLRQKDFQGLFKMASRSHFSIGLGAGHLVYCKTEKLFEQLEKDLMGSENIVVDPINCRSIGKRIYVKSHGWKGKLLDGEVPLLLVQTQHGWEWRGVVLQNIVDYKQVKKYISEDSLPYKTPPIKKTSKTKSHTGVTIADLNIKCPWPNGRTFRAGGVYNYAQEQAAVTFAPWPINMLLLAAFASRPYGFGINGFYYNQAPTHTGLRDQYAVDFTAYQPGVPMLDVAAGTQALSVADGLVISLEGSYPTGHSTDGEHNYVEIDHYTDEEWFAAFFSWLLTGEWLRSTYSARYLHLDGPGDIRVSEGMKVDQGTILGTMDDTGTSVVPHLHFSMHENFHSRAAVRPTPMDNQTLLDGEDGKGITSSNIPVV